MQKTIIVLGMHRSATSLVAKSMSTNVHMGRLGTPSMLDCAMPDNPEGHFENLDFVKLNDCILNAAGGSWYNPPSHHAILSVIPEYEYRVRQVIHANQKDVPWGWKDPRTTLTIDHYLPFIDDPIIVPVFRSPHKVAGSLAYRNPNMFTDQTAMELVHTYNSRLIMFLSRFTGVCR